MEKTDNITKMKALLSRQAHYIKDLERKLRIEKRKSSDLETTVNFLKRMMKKGE